MECCPLTLHHHLNIASQNLPAVQGWVHMDDPFPSNVQVGLAEQESGLEKEWILSTAAQTESYIRQYMSFFSTIRLVLGSPADRLWQL
jgi:hypothetical protein